jgi:hypothetical protein
MRCRPDGTPERLRRGGREHKVTHVAATWERPAAWWTGTTEHPNGDPLYGERCYYRLVLDGIVVYEVFRAGGRWFLERIIN